MKEKFRLLLLVLICAVLSIKIIKAQSVLELDQGAHKWGINEYAQIQKKEPINDGIEVFIKDSTSFKSLSSNQVNYGITNATYCFKFSVKQAVLEEQEYFLHINMPSLDSIELYEEHSMELSYLGLKGRCISNASNLYAYHHAFKIHISDTSKHTYYLRVRVDGNATIPIKLYRSGAWSNFSSWDILLFGFFIGMILLLTFFNLVLYFKLKELTYLYYALFCLGTFSFVFFRFRIDLIWFSEISFIRSMSYSIYVFLLQGFFALFTISFLTTSRFIPRWTSFLKGMIAILFCMSILSPFLPNQTLTQLSVLMSIIGNLTMLITGILVWYKGNKGAKKYILGLLALTLSIILYSLSTAGIISSVFSSFHLMRGGVMIEMLFITYLILEKYSLSIAALHLKKRESQESQMKAQLLAEELEDKSKVLFTTAMEVVQKKEVIQQIQEDLNSGKQNSNDQLLKILRGDKQKEKDWENFRTYFENVHQDFFTTIAKEYPKLTVQDQRMCAFIKINLSTKEIATLLNVKPTSVQVNRHRLKKKLNLGADDDLIHFIQNL